MPRLLRALVLLFACLIVLPAPALATVERTEVVHVESTLLVDAPMMSGDELPGEDEPLPGEEGSSWFQDNKVLVIVLAVSAGVLLAASTVVICCCCLGSSAYY